MNCNVDVIIILISRGKEHTRIGRRDGNCKWRIWSSLDQSGAWKLHLYHREQNVEEFRYAALKSLKDFFFLITYEKAGKRTSKITTHCNITFLNKERTKKFFCKTSSAKRIRVLVGGSRSGLWSRKWREAIKPSSCGMLVYNDLTSIENKKQCSPWKRKVEKILIAWFESLI